MTSKGCKAGKGAHRNALSLDSSMGISKTEKGKSVASSQPCDEVDIVSYDHVTMEADVHISETARNAFDTVLQSATFSQVGDSLVYGNSLGHTILAEREEYRSRFDAIDAEVSSLWKTIETHSSEIVDLQARIRDLETACEGYLKIRQRFLDTYRRDVLKDPNVRWTDEIGLGNKAAQNGDAVTDARLYETGARNDQSLLVKIYGLDASQILDLSRTRDHRSISILNARATLKAHKEKPTPEKIEDAWNEYVAQLEFYWGKTPEDPQSALGQAYYRFWKVHGEHQ
ncbi:MAG: hypothetical protein M1839_006444 [Geoglossum umbratile]|nr:MAG: hypothetical protein M1839_006444 [Geoglossum umbratile]